MTLTVVRYDTETGDVTGLWFELDHDYEPADNELVRDVEIANPGVYRVDTSVDPPEVVEDSDYVMPDNIDRSKVSEETKQAYRDASGDAEAKADILFAILTGESP